jgi:uncharacterized protein (TIGR02284 family)
MNEEFNTLNSKTAHQLNDLIELNIDSAKGFETAAAGVNDPSLREVFREIGPERRANAEELKGFLTANDEKPSHEGTFAGAAHRWWIDLRTKLSTNDSKVILEEAERGEDAIKHKYEDVLVETAGSPVNDVIQRQYDGVRRGHDRIRDLRNRFRRLDT